MGGNRTVIGVIRVPAISWSIFVDVVAIVVAGYKYYSGESQALDSCLDGILICLFWTSLNFFWACCITVGRGELRK